MNKIKLGSILGAVSILSSVIAFAAANPHIGTITQIQGEVQVFSHPSRNIQGPAPHALFEGEYYSVASAKLGDKVEKGNIVRTPVGGLAKIVFENGDQIHVGNATAYRVFIEEKPAKTSTTFRLLYGKLRSVVSKAGPRNNLQVKTSDVVMGVRGTDFYVERRSGQKATEVSTLRGAVELKSPTASKNEKPVEVKAGYTAVVATTAPATQVAKDQTAKPTGDSPAQTVEKTKAETKIAAPVLPKIDVRKTDQGDLADIQKISVIKKELAATPEQAKLAEPVVQEIQKLEAKAVQNTLQDIKATDPKLFEQVVKVAKQQPEVKSEDLNMRTIEKAIEVAPPAPAKVKPRREELENESDSYSEYFKNVD